MQVPTTITQPHGLFNIPCGFPAVAGRGGHSCAAEHVARREVAHPTTAPSRCHVKSEPKDPTAARLGGSRERAHWVGHTSNLRRECRSTRVTVVHVGERTRTSEVCHRRRDVSALPSTLHATQYSSSLLAGSWLATRQCESDTCPRPAAPPSPPATAPTEVEPGEASSSGPSLGKAPGTLGSTAASSPAAPHTLPSHGDDALWVDAGRGVGTDTGTPKESS